MKLKENGFFINLNVSQIMKNELKNNDFFLSNCSGHVPLQIFFQGQENM